MVHNDEQPFNVPHVNCGLRTFGIHAGVAKFSYKPSRPLRGLNYRRDAFSIACKYFQICSNVISKKKIAKKRFGRGPGKDV